MELNKIIDGHIKELFNREQELYEYRINICHNCKLMTKDRIFGEICDNKKWLNPSTGELSLTKIDGYINGCGCRLQAANRVPEKTCVLKKW